MCAHKGRAPSGDAGPVPKGGQCIVCSKQESDCSGLDFKSMPVFKELSDGTTIVECSEFKYRGFF